MGKPGKATQAEKQRRITETYALVLSGLRRAQILQIVSERFDISERMAEHYLAAAQAEIREMAMHHRDAMFAEHISHRRDMRFRARRDGNLRIELDAARDEAELLKLYPAKEVDIHDWRKEAEREGVNADELFEQLVAAAMGKLSGAGGDAGGDAPREA